MIIINRMFSGGYLNESLGHEIINLFKADNGRHYIYVNPYGTINEDAKDAHKVLLVRAISKHCFEILACASELKLLLGDELFVSGRKRGAKEELKRQSEMIEAQNIAYGGVPLNELFESENDSPNAAYITFETSNFKKPKFKFYIIDDEKLIDETHFLVPFKFSSQSLKQYVQGESALDKIFAPELWQENDTTKRIGLNEILNFKAKEQNILEIIGKMDDELSFSNWIVYYLRNDAKLFLKFASEILRLSVSEDAQILREYKNIDIFIKDQNHAIVIENKIKSGINGIRHDLQSGVIRSQLDKYSKIADKQDSGGRAKCFLLLPDYSYADRELAKFDEYGRYSVIRYSALLRFFETCECGLKFYDEFKDALRKHASEYKKDFYEIMGERLIMIILRHRGLSS